MSKLSWAFLILCPGDFSYMFFLCISIMHKESKWCFWIRKLFHFQRLQIIWISQKYLPHPYTSAQWLVSQVIYYQNLLSSGRFVTCEREAGKSEAVLNSKYVSISHLVVTHNKEFRTTEITFRRRLKMRYHDRGIQVDL